MLATSIIHAPYSSLISCIRLLRENCLPFMIAIAQLGHRLYRLGMESI